MLDGGYRYSLCVSYLGKAGQPLSYRVADFNTEKDCFEKAYYTQKDNIGYHGVFNPVIIGANPEELTMYQAEIRKWVPTEYDNTKQWSYPFKEYEGEIYEVIKPQEFNKIDVVTDNKIREVLQRGIIINEEIDKKFLMVIDSVGDSFVVIRCSKSDFIQDANLYYISENVKDMLHTKHYFQKYQIEKQDVVSTQLLIDTLYASNIKNVRCFYYRTELENTFGKFYIRSVESYTNTFLTKYFKQHKEKYQLTKNEIRKLLDIMKQVKNSEAEINEFFVQTGYDYEIAKDAINQYADHIIQAFSKPSELDVIIERCLLNDENIYNQCIETVKEQWFKESDKDREEKQQEIQKIASEAKKCSDELENVKEKIKENEKKLDTTQVKVDEAEGKLQSLVDKKAKIETDIKQHIDRFRNDIVYATELIGVAGAVGSKGGRENTNIKLYIRHAERIPVDRSTEVDDISDIVEFCEELSDNISQHFEEEFELSATVISALVNDKAIILSDSVGEIIANDVSALVDASTADYVFISSIQEDLSEIINLINESEMKTVYIDGVVNAFNESIFIGICKNCKNKHLFFGSGTKDIVNMLSKNIWNYAIYLETENYVCVPTKENLRIGNYDLLQINIQSEEKEVLKYYKQMKLFVRQGLMTNKIGVDYAYLLSSYHQIIAGDRMGIPLLYSIYLCCKGNDSDSDEYEEKLKSCKINESDIEKLKNR
ncbi:hypothetical protein [Clostridium ljungdahlii]|uniref:Uncharacterized protein n=1 Tax=Clostridium ljungdahlii TaxID=1538 RepID=A0A162LCV3_9CLOT|nr:hypothetical protein [Clostridium ljungdahlii]OAA91886.1 hypothetical protein WY13_00288 [Clostridium ljungdahlii]